MNTIVKDFIQKVIETHSSGHAREHSYRPALKELFEQVTKLNVINEPKRSEYGAPDFVFLKGKIVIAYAEAKDINVPLDDIEKSEQMERYYGYSNIILTNGLEFRFYRNISPYGEPIIIGKLNGKSIDIFESSFESLADTIGDFIKESKEPIKSGKVLSKVMAGKARRIRDNVKKFLEDEDNSKNENLLGIYEVIKKLLIPDLDKKKFADMYAQTLVYGLFVARYYDTSTDTFSRQEARDLVPASNPFLREFFNHIAGSSFDPRIEYIVNELCEEFNHADVQAIVHDYYRVEKDGSRDPIIHFYEDFLQEYDSTERKKMGVFYTPLPVVHFIIRAVDDILKKDFNLSQGLADTSKIKHKFIADETDARFKDGVKKVDVDVHRVQILDPATGTGTFLNEVIHHIKKSFEGQEGRWNQYVNNDLLPRLHGFELMMASYTIAHLKLSSTIIETGAKIENNRLGVYLTNSLEKGEREVNNLFNIGLGKAITEESNQANRVKNELPIMVVIGNPPYSGESSNNFESANNLINKYKFEPGGINKLKERNPKWLNDDYVKFIALAEELIEKNGEGILGYITNHSYLDNPTFRGMRWELTNMFDDIYIIDLHGNSKKKETAPNGGKDENVFNIQQGVSIVLGVKKNNNKKKEGEVYYAEIYGERDKKFKFLADDIKYKKIDLDQKYYFFVPKNTEGKEVYEQGFSVNEIFTEYSVGIVTGRDGVAIAESKDLLKKNISEYFIGKEFNFEEEKIKKISYRPFDSRYVYYDKEVVGRGRWNFMQHLLLENLSLFTIRQFKTGDSWQHVFLSENITESTLVSNRTSEIGYTFSLYLYTENGSKIPNLKKEIVDGIEKCVDKVTPEDVFDYIYAVLHSPTYREKYKEFLKIDFPRVPYPKDKKQFNELVALGRELREIHLLESSKINHFITTYSVSGSDVVEKVSYKDGKVFINPEQYFGNVPQVVWDFYIGGYQPAQKWLKDRKGRILTNTDIEHYQKIIVALTETGRIMKEIDRVWKII